MANPEDDIQTHYKKLKDWIIDKSGDTKCNWNDSQVNLFISDELIDEGKIKLKKNCGVGVWIRIRVMWELLSKHNKWTQDELTHDLISRLVEHGADISQIKFDNLKRLTSSTWTEVRPSWVETLIDDLWSSWHLLGLRRRGNKPPLDFERDELGRGYFATPAELQRELERRVAAIAEGKKVAREEVWARLQSSLWTRDVMIVPAFAARGVGAHRDAVDRLTRFASALDHSDDVFALAGEPESGKGGLLRVVVEQLYKDLADGNPPTRPVLYVDFARLRSLEPVVSRVEAFLTAALAAQRAGRVVPDDGLEESGGPIELKLQRIVRLSCELGHGALFLFGNVPALTAGDAEGSPYVLRDDRLDRLIRLLQEKQALNRIILALVPQNRRPWQGAARGGSINLVLRPPGADHLGTFIDRFLTPTTGIQLAGVERRQLVSRLQSKLVEADDEAPVSSRIIIAALALDSVLRRTEGGTGGIGDTGADDLAIRDAAQQKEPDPILKRIWQLLGHDPREHATLAMLALSYGGLKRETLINLLRYHRLYFTRLRDRPSGCIAWGRAQLASEDAAFIDAFILRLATMIGRHRARPEPLVDGPTAKLTDVAYDLFDFIPGLQPSFRRTIEAVDPVLASEAHFLLARERRREAMRVRLAGVGPHGASLEELWWDLGAAAHLLASIRSEPTEGEPCGHHSDKDLPRLEHRVFMRRARPAEIVGFVVHEILGRDADLGSARRLSNLLLADDALLEILLRLFHLGHSSPEHPDSAGAQDLLRQIPATLTRCLPIDEIATVITRVAAAALRLHDFDVLWPAISLINDLTSHGASLSSIQRLRLIHFDALVLVGRHATKLGHGRRVDDRPSAMELASVWLQELGGPPLAPTGDWEPHAVATGADSVDLTVATANLVALGAGHPALDEALWMRGKLLARLGEIAESTGSDDRLAIHHFAEAEAIGRRLARPDRFPLLSGASGRRWLRSLLRHAAVARANADRNAFDWAKAKAEAIHRENMRRLSAYPSERTAILIDEALLERHLRGSASAGNLLRSYKVLRDDHDGVLALGAPARIRLEHNLERARSAKLLAELNVSSGASLRGEALQEVERLQQLIASRYAADGSVVDRRPSYFWFEAGRLREALVGEHHGDEAFVSMAERRLVAAGYRADELATLAFAKADLVAAVGNQPWANDPLLP